MTQSEIAKEQIRSDYDLLHESGDRLRESEGFYLWVLEKLKPTREAAILDIACGQGLFVYLARQKGLRSFGLDISPSAARISKKVNSKAIACNADGEALPFKSGGFDYAVNLGSLEHFLSPEQGIREMRRILRPEGLAAILLPNSYYLVDVIWKVWRTGYSSTHSQIVERFATIGEWKDFLEKNGLEVMRVHAYNSMFPKTRNDWTWYFKHPRKFLYSLTSPFIPFNLSYCFLYICKNSPKALL